MTSRALERQIADFIGLVESQLARLIHTFHETTRKLSTPEKHRTLRDAFIVAWRRREHFDPLAEPIHVWFERCLRIAQTEGIQIEGDELLMLQRLSPDIDVQSFVATPPAPLGVIPASSGPTAVVGTGAEASGASRGTDAQQKLGKECPPCWRCKYHQGWLPRKTPKHLLPTFMPQTEIDLICAAIDKRKIEIANYVRGEYSEELLED